MQFFPSRARARFFGERAKNGGVGGKNFCPRAVAVLRCACSATLASVKNF